MADTGQLDTARLAKQLDKITNNLTKVQVVLAELNLRHEHLVESMEQTEKRAKEELGELRDQISRLSARLSEMEKLIWKAVGATAIVALSLPYLFKLL